MANYLDFFQEQDNLNQQGRLLGYVLFAIQLVSLFTNLKKRQYPPIAGIPKKRISEGSERTIDYKSQERGDVATEKIEYEEEEDKQ